MRCELLRQNDVFALGFAPEYGGTGTGTLTFLRAVEELSWADATVGLVLAVQSLGAIAIELSGSAEQKQRYLPRWASGEWIGAYALTEAGSGSDARAMLTTARRDGDGWVIDGSKRFITNAGVAHTYVVFARTGDAISAFVVEQRRARVLGVADRAEDGHQGIDHRRAGVRRLPGGRRGADRRGGQRVPHGDAGARPLAAGDRRPGAGHRPGGARLRAALRDRAGDVRQAAVASTRASSSCWPTWRSRSRPAAGCSTTSA